MDQNHIAHGAFAAAATDEPAALPSFPGASWATPPAADPTEDPHDFASEAEAIAYWQGLADGIRQSGGLVPARLAARLAREEEGLLVPFHGNEEAPPSNSQDTLAFSPAHLRSRHDGWTPQKQIAFVEALAETGIVRAAAARIGMDPRSVSRLRRRADARAFDRACDAAARIGRRELVSIAYERVVEGTIKRHYFHGELKAEERVYDNRLLMALIARLPQDAHEADLATRDVEQNWDGWMDAIAQGRDAPEPPPAPEPTAAPVEYSVWEDGGDLLTNCPPPPGYHDFQEGEPGERFYQRRLSDAEEEYWEQDGESSADEGDASDTWLVAGPDFFARGCGLSGLSEAAAEGEIEGAGAALGSGEELPTPPAPAALEPPAP